MPFPSAGCQTCKARRIKCDEAQPACQRCLRARRICRGMGTRQAYSVVHSENSYASGQIKRPRGPRSTSTVELTDKLGAVPQFPLINLKTQAITYYVHYHLQTTDEATSISKTAADVFLPMCMSRAECPILDLAVSSLALAVFSRIQQHPQAAIEASMKYHRLLQVAQVTFLSLNKENIDICLLAIFFMSRYESAIHRPSHSNLRSSFTTTLKGLAHHDGALAILKIWKHHMSHSRPSTDVVKHTRRGMIRSALMRNLALPEWILEGSSFGEHGLELEYDSIVIRIVNVRHRLFTLLGKKTTLQCTSQELALTAEDISEEARDIDKALQDWTAHFPSSWRYQRHSVSSSHPWPTRDFYSPTVYSYPSPAHAALWNHYYTSRMLINSTHWRVLELDPPNSDDFVHEQRLECLFHINTMANDLASSVPYCLQRFTVTDSPNSSSHHNSIVPNADEDIKPYLANLIIWSLSIASSLRDVDVEQQSWFRSELARLGRMVGVGVFECAETDQWLEL